MKRTTILILLAIATISVAAQAERELKNVLNLKIPGTRTEGANAGSVAWHPVQKKYYAAMAGNAKHFVGVYDIKGTLLNSTDQQSLFDIRGIWYNSNTKTIQMNGYNDYGWAEYILDKKGFPSDIKILHDDMNQPAAQSVGAFDPKSNVVYFFNEEGHVDRYNYREGAYEDYVDIKLGAASDDEAEDNLDVIEDYNSTTVVFTGISGAELGLLNVFNNEIELYNIKTGFVTRKLKLPSNAPVEDFLDFAYCNGIFWLFDKEARIWKGYK
jgi:hypothetical protein